MRALKLALALPLLTLLTPVFALAGSQTYATPGTYTFTVPQYTGTLTVTVNGAGGGGAGGCGFTYFDGPNACSSGDGGGQSVFGGIIGYGGSGASREYGSPNAGANGGASGGDTNGAGDGALGGAGGMSAGRILSAPGGAGSTDYYPGERVSAGGNGGRAAKSFTTTTLAPGTSVTVTVGSGGAGGVGTEGATIDPNSCVVSYGDQSSQQPICSDSSGRLPAGTDGSPGENGSVNIVWTDTNDLPNPPTPAPTCSITFDQNPIADDGSTTMRWTSTNADLFYINNVSYVGASGSATVYQPGDYSGTVSGPGGTASCPATLSSTTNQCTPAAPTCNPTTGNLVDNCGTLTQCPYGCSTVTNQCNTTQQCTNGLNIDTYPSCTCPAGQVQSGSICVPACTNGLNAAQYPSCVCPAGQVQSGSYCVNNLCPNGLDKTMYPSCTCPAGQVQSGTICIANVPTITQHLTVSPSLVQPGFTSKVFWEVSNAQSCTVTGTNGDGILGSGTGIWNTLSGGSTGKTTSPITEQTTFTLFCNAFPGAFPATVQESATVNIVPGFQEI